MRTREARAAARCRVKCLGVALSGIAILLALTPTTSARAEQGVVDDEFIGVLFSRTEVLLRAEIAGRVVSVSAELGKYVDRGLVIVRLDDRSLKLKLSEALARIQATLAEVEAASTESLVTWNRYLARSQASEMWSKEEVARAKLEFDQAAARMAVVASSATLARSAAAALRLELEATRIRAPYSGWVAAKFAKVGQQMMAGDPIVRLIGDEGLWVRFAVPDGVDEFAPPQTQVKVRLPASGVTLSGVVRYQSPEIDAASAMTIVEAELTIPDRLRQYARSGAAVRVRL